MAKREVVWTDKSQVQLQKILTYFTDRNKSNRYAKNLYKRFQNQLDKAAINPEIGIKTKVQNIRGLIIRDYILFYELSENKLMVLNVWDFRQNPDILSIRR